MLLSVAEENMFKKSILGLVLSPWWVFSAFADTSIYLNQNQLQQAQQSIIEQGNKAIANVPQTQQELSKYQKVDTAVSESLIKQSQRYFNAAPLKNTMPDGQKYFLYSESLVQQNNEYLAKNKKPLDVNQAISDYNAITKNAKLQLGDNRMLIFISSSMPKKTITNLMTQASSLGAVFVVRGLINGSYAETHKYFFSFKGNNKVGIMINPTLFKAFDVTQVPTFAVYKSKQDLLKTACNVAPEFVKVSGDVTLRYALERLNQSTNSDLAQIAANELAVLDSSGFYQGR